MIINGFFGETDATADVTDVTSASLQLNRSLPKPGTPKHAVSPPDIVREMLQRKMLLEMYK